MHTEAIFGMWFNLTVIIAGLFYDCL
jgi:hypothetical protein